MDECASSNSLPQCIIFESVMQVASTLTCLDSTETETNFMTTSFTNFTTYIFSVVSCSVTSKSILYGLCSKVV